MDLVAGVNRVLVMLEHTAQNGKPKLLSVCTLPLTGKHVVKRVITDLAILDIRSEGFIVRELAPGVTEQEVIDKTAAAVRFDLKEAGVTR